MIGHLFLLNVPYATALWLMERRFSFIFILFYTGSSSTYYKRSKQERVVWEFHNKYYASSSYFLAFLVPVFETIISYAFAYLLCLWILGTVLLSKSQFSSQPALPLTLATWIRGYINLSRYHVFLSIAVLRVSAMSPNKLITDKQPQDMGSYKTTSKQ